jgi:hypothetical protein
MPTFTASRLSSNNNTLYPARIEINSTNIIYYKGYVWGYKSTAIARSNIASISIDTGIFFADVVIESNGGKKVVASGFKNIDARAIVSLLT